MTGLLALPAIVFALALSMWFPVPLAILATLAVASLLIPPPSFGPWPGEAIARWWRRCWEIGEPR